jgi:copper transport protein
VTASLPAAGIDQVNMPVLRVTENHAIGAISLPAPGQWQFQFTLRTSEIDQDSVTAQVPIK